MCDTNVNRNLCHEVNGNFPSITKINDFNLRINYKDKAFLFENVQHIVKHDEGKTLKRINEELSNLEYSFFWKVIRASEFGLPQHRPRTFIVGFRDEKNIIKNFNFPKPIKLKKTMSDIFDGECGRDIGFTLRLGGMGSGINDRRNWDSYLVNGEVIKLQAEHGKKMQGLPLSFKLPKSRTISLKLLGAITSLPHVLSEDQGFLFNDVK